MTWLEVGGGYQLTVDLSNLDRPTIRARNAKGKDLANVPDKVRKTDEHATLEGVVDRLRAHRTDVHRQVTQQMLDSLPVPTVQICAVWPDQFWRACLTDLVVDVDGTRGLLRDAADNRLGVVALDGETVWPTGDSVRLLHPVLLGADLDDYRELAAELGVSQGVDQLMRQTWQREPDRKSDDREVRDFVGAQYEQLNHAYARATSGGYPIRGGYAVCQLWEDGEQIEARLWIGAEYFDALTILDALVWVRDNKVLTLGEVPPVAWSEGMRLGHHLWAGRTTAGDEQ